MALIKCPESRPKPTTTARSLLFGFNFISSTFSVPCVLSSFIYEMSPRPETMPNLISHGKNLPPSHRRNNLPSYKFQHENDPIAREDDCTYYCAALGSIRNLLLVPELTSWLLKPKNNSRDYFNSSSKDIINIILCPIHLNFGPWNAMPVCPISSISKPSNEPAACLLWEGSPMTLSTRNENMLIIPSALVV